MAATLANRAEPVDQATMELTGGGRAPKRRLEELAPEVRDRLRSALANSQAAPAFQPQPMPCPACGQEVAAAVVQKEKNRGCFYWCCRSCDLFFRMVSPDGGRVILEKTAHERLDPETTRCGCGERALRFRRGDRDGWLYRCPLGRCNFFRVDHATRARQLQGGEEHVQRLDQLFGRVVQQLVRAGRSADDPLTAADLLQVTQVGAEERDRVSTFEQGSEAWHRSRDLRVGASVVGAILGHNAHQKPEGVLRGMLFGSRMPPNKLMRYGTVMEALVRDNYRAWKHGVLMEPVVREFGDDPDLFAHRRLLTDPSSHRGQPLTRFQELLGELEADRAGSQASPASPADQDQADPANPADRANQANAADQADQDPEESTGWVAPWDGRLQPPNLRILESGFLVDAGLGFLGASPDGVVLYREPATGEQVAGILEIKTRLGNKPLDWSDQKLARYADCPAPPGVPAYYYDQMVVNMGIHQDRYPISFADFVVSNGRSLRVTRIPWEPTARQYWETVVRPGVDRFYRNVFLPAMLDALAGRIGPGTPLDSLVRDNDIHGDQESAAGQV